MFVLTQISETKRNYVNNPQFTLVSVWNTHCAFYIDLLKLLGLFSTMPLLKTGKIFPALLVLSASLIIRPNTDR